MSTTIDRARTQARRVALPIFPGDDTPPRRVTREEALAAILAAGGRQPLAAAVALGKIVDALLARILPAGPTPACAKGCAWCCRDSYVNVTAPEAILAVGWARKNLPPAQVAAIRARAKSNAKRAKGAGPMAYPRQACAFLFDEACSIYPVRPANCRAVHSRDANACKAAHDAHSPEDIPMVPLRFDALEHVRSMMLGYQEALVHAKCDATTYELQQVVHLLLSDPETATRWAACDTTALAPARSRE